MTERRDRKAPGDQLAHLSDDDVARRLGGGAGLGGPVEPRPPAQTPPPGGRPPSRGRGMLWRDGAMAVALLAFLFLGARFALNWQPTSSQASSSPGSSDVALASASPVPVATTPAPPATPSPTPFEVIPSDLPTATPAPTSTPLPTPTPTAPPRTPTPAPGTATLVVSVIVKPPQYGGNDVPGDWSVSVKGAGASPASFAGKPTGTTVRINAGQSFAVSTVAKTKGGYTQTLTGDCSGKAKAGVTLNCTFNEFDRPAGVNVAVVLDGASNAFSILVAATGPFVHCAFVDSGHCTFNASVAPHTANFSSNHAYAVSGAPSQVGYNDPTYSAGCTGGGLAEGTVASCVITYTATAQVPAMIAVSGIGPAALLTIVRRRRDRQAVTVVP